ncbi:MAG: phosphoadenylyl-sulfate reductase [Sphingomonadaceae bacterium]
MSGVASRRADLRQYRGSDAGWLAAHLSNASAEAAIASVLQDAAWGRVAVVSSFGAESAVLLDIVADVNRHVPVIFVNTLRLFPETLCYAQDLTAHLGLSDVRWVEPDPAALARADPRLLRWSYDPDGCCEVRKVEPLARALQDFDTWISGRKRFQSGTRAGLAKVEADGERLKVNPLADWDAGMLAGRAAERRLPPHPLVAEGYPSIGCVPCTSKVQPGEDPRAGRWRGWDKTECGIHTALPGSDPVF